MLGCSAPTQPDPLPTIAALSSGINNIPGEPIYEGELNDGQMISQNTIILPQTAYQSSDAPTLNTLGHVFTSQSVIDASLETELTAMETTNAPDVSIEVAVTFAETHTIPLFPSLVESEPRESVTNQGRLQMIQQNVKDIEAARAPDYAEKSAFFF